ncbi:MAG: hypothetical protein BGO01_04125 [Armatimonadetes bacterium 55-13]|nr:hypothetical protein [Armatimonadota bacterium]OJU63336.1 MAG: hypothetical protein BGO01_04125 [Armatimonadetes bacterium 55-13]
MKPLLFLTARTFVNGIRRAVTNPRRLIGLIMALAWLGRYIFFPFRGERVQDFSRANAGRATELISSMDAVRIMDALVFTFFAFITLFLALGSLNTRTSFRPADVDVLFPTPVEPKLVLVFRIFRDYLVTLLAPLFFIVVGYRPAAAGVTSLKRVLEDPSAISQTMRLASIAWFLVALSWVCINYAASLFMNRSDLASDRNKRIFGWSMATIIVSVFGFIYWQATQFDGWRDAVNLAESPVLRTIFFTATLAAWIVHGIVQGEALPTIAGLAGLLGIIVISIRIAMTQAGWMYDQAAVRGFDSINARKLQQSGDTIGLMVEQARRGKLKARRTRWIARINAPGGWALLWREAIIMLRSTLPVIILFSLMTMGLSLIPLFAERKGSAEVAGGLFILFQAFGAFIMSSAIAQAGFIEMLRRVDVQKPLPFSFSNQVLFEIMAKALLAIIISWVCSILMVVAKPALWQFALATMIAMPFLSVLLCGVTCLMTILFPDYDDPTQRGFRGLMNLVGIVASCSPGVVIFILLTAIHLSPIISALIVSLVNMGVIALVSMIAGNQYAQFNPSE